MTRPTRPPSPGRPCNNKAQRNAQRAEDGAGASRPSPPARPHNVQQPAPPRRRQQGTRPRAGQIADGPLGICHADICGARAGMREAAGGRGRADKVVAICAGGVRGSPEPPSPRRRCGLKRLAGLRRPYRRSLGFRHGGSMDFGNIGAFPSALARQLHGPRRLGRGDSIGLKGSGDPMRSGGAMDCGGLRGLRRSPGLRRFPRLRRPYVLRRLPGLRRSHGLQRPPWGFGQGPRRSRGARGSRVLAESKKTPWAPETLGLSRSPGLPGLRLGGARGRWMGWW